MTEQLETFTNDEKLQEIAKQVILNPENFNQTQEKFSEIENKKDLENYEIDKKRKLFFWRKEKIEKLDYTDPTLLPQLLDRRKEISAEIERIDQHLTNISKMIKIAKK